ncbi:hypothetical protein II906_02720 [bacterium]|nr:hypothetical protein [bacterium]
MKLSSDILWNYKKSLMSPKGKSLPPVGSPSRLGTLAQKVEADKLNTALKAYNVGIVKAASSADITPEKLAELIDYQAMNITKADVKVMYDGISQMLESQNVKASEQDIKYAMKVLTQFANIQSFVKVDEQLDRGCTLKYYNGIPAGLSDFMNVLDDKKNLLSDRYRGMTDKRVSYFFADKFTLDSLSPEDKDEILKYKPEIVYLTGFDCGINFFNQTANYSAFKTRIVSIISRVKENQGDKDFKTALIEQLNKDGEQYAREYGFKIDRFINIDDGRDADFGDIADNLNFKVPSAKEIDVLITALAEYIDNSETFLYRGRIETLKKALMKWYYTNIRVYSPKRINEGMRLAWQKIRSVIDSDNPEEEMLFVVQHSDKSDSYMTRHFAEANGINPQKIMSQSKFQRDFEKNKYKTKYAVMVDDISASGSSLLSSVGSLELNYGAKCLYSPLVITDKAAKKIINQIDDYNVNKQSKLIINDYVKNIDNLDGEYTLEERRLLARLFDRKPSNIGRGGYSNTNTAVLFPVMTPDNNNTLMSLFAERILLERYAAKSLYNLSVANYVNQRYEEMMSEG